MNTEHHAALTEIDVATEKRNKLHHEELDRAAVKLSKHDEEGATALADLNTKHDAQLHEARTAHDREMATRMEEMNAKARKYREDLDASDREKQRLMSEHH